jgi:asparagine synthase (glutamine-hydrolysing)
MCGIAGIITRNDILACQLEQVACMSRTLVHRGPDGAGEYRDAHLAMGMRRLSIIDLSTARQPLFEEDRSLALIANGEIYNYVELREQLRARGHVFSTDGDCETILHLYEDHGVDCVHHLRGMFAFALWDMRRGTLLLARDRMGEKPLYVYEQDGLLAFASELKTLLRSGVAPPRLESRATEHFFYYHYVPEPLTPVQGVRKLDAGCTLQVTVDPWRVEERAYWRMDDSPPLDGDPARLIRQQLETIGEIVIRSDVPVGVALSGGLDSSTIAVIAARNYPGTMHAFSVGYAGRPQNDERLQAQDLAKTLGMPFHEVEISSGQVVDSFLEVVRWQDDPIADMSGVGYLAIARAAHHAGVPVLLQGQGGDELFWGYSWVAQAVRHTLRKSRIDPARGPRFRDYLELSWPKLFPRRAPIDWVTSLAGMRTSLAAYHRDRLSPRERMVFFDLTDQFRLAAEQARTIHPPEFLASLRGNDPYDLFTHSLPWPHVSVAITRLICDTYLRENGIAQGDRLSMATSVELRLPLVDYRLVETVIGLRKAHSDHHLSPKNWLREAVSDLLPEEILKRPKRGFQTPVRDWYRPLFARHGHLLRNGRLVELGVLRPEAAEGFARGSYPLQESVPRAFNALVLEAWCREVLFSA